MKYVHQLLQIVLFSFRRWRRNPRIILTFTLAFLLCLMLTDKAVSFAKHYHTVMQLVEAFVWVFGDADSIMMSSLLVTLLFLDMPLIDEAVPYYLLRMNRSVWILGQILYIMTATLIYIAFLFAVTCLICAPLSFPGNMWSETGALLGYSGIGEKIALPASVRTMEMSLPYQCAAVICVLILLYCLFLAVQMIMLRINGNKTGSVISVFIINLYGLLLKPELFQKLLKLPQTQLYKANVLAGWLSPLNHATYYMHNFGYDYLPRLWMSCAVFLTLIGICIIATLKRVKKFEFQFQQKTDG